MDQFWYWFRFAPMPMQIFVLFIVLALGSEIIECVYKIIMFLLDDKKEED